MGKKVRIPVHKPKERPSITFKELLNRCGLALLALFTGVLMAAISVGIWYVATLVRLFDQPRHSITTHHPSSLTPQFPLDYPK